MAEGRGASDAPELQARAAEVGQLATVVLDVAGMSWASEKAVVESVLGRRPGVRSVEANPVSQTATVTFDPAWTSVAELRRWVTECGYHCSGQSVPSHLCDPMAEPGPVDGHGALPAGYSRAAGPAVTPAPGIAEPAAREAAARTITRVPVPDLCCPVGREPGSPVKRRLLLPTRPEQVRMAWLTHNAWALASARSPFDRTKATVIANFDAINTNPAVRLSIGYAGDIGKRQQSPVSGAQIRIPSGRGGPRAARARCHGDASTHGTGT